MFDGINLQCSSYFLFIILYLQVIFANNLEIYPFYFSLTVGILFFIFLNINNKSYLGDSGVYILSFIFNQLCSQSLHLPCNDPLIILAEEKGIKAIPLVDIKRYKKLVKECENLGEKEKIKRLIYNDWQRDYEKIFAQATIRFQISKK